MKDIKTTSISDQVVSRFSEKNCIVINHAAPASVQNDEEALEYVWYEVMCSGNHWNIHFLCTPQGNVYLLNPAALHHCFDHGRMSFQELKKSLFVGEYQLTDSLPDTGIQNPRMLNLCGVYGIK